MKLYTLKQEWQNAQSLEDAIDQAIQWEQNVALRQGSAGIKLSKIPALVAGMFDVIKQPKTRSVGLPKAA